jgi:hypothetical protein
VGRAFAGGKESGWDHYRVCVGKVTETAYFKESLIERLEKIQQNIEGIIPITVNLW